MFKHAEIAKPRSAVELVMYQAHIHLFYNKGALVDLHRRGAAKPPFKDVTPLSNQGLDTKESKDCF